jgi:hypothetical protein
VEQELRSSSASAETINEKIAVLKVERNNAVEENVLLQDDLSKERQRVERVKTELEAALQKTFDQSSKGFMDELQEERRCYEQLLREERRRNKDLQDRLRSTKENNSSLSSITQEKPEEKPEEEIHRPASPWSSNLLRSRIQMKTKEESMSTGEEVPEVTAKNHSSSDAMIALLIEERDEARKKLLHMTNKYNDLKDDSALLTTELTRLQRKVGKS